MQRARVCRNSVSSFEGCSPLLPHNSLRLASTFRIGGCDRALDCPLATLGDVTRLSAGGGALPVIMSIISPRETHDYRNYNLLVRGTNTSGKGGEKGKKESAAGYTRCAPCATCHVISAVGSTPVLRPAPAPPHIPVRPVAPFLMVDVV